MHIHLCKNYILVPTPPTRLFLSPFFFALLISNVANTAKTTKIAKTVKTVKTAKAAKTEKTEKIEKTEKTTKTAVTTKMLLRQRKSRVGGVGTKM